MGPSTPQERRQAGVAYSLRQAYVDNMTTTARKARALLLAPLLLAAACNGNSSTSTVACYEMAQAAETYNAALSATRAGTATVTDYAEQMGKVAGRLADIPADTSEPVKSSASLIVLHAGRARVAALSGDVLGVAAEQVAVVAAFAAAQPTCAAK